MLDKAKWKLGIKINIEGIDWEQVFTVMPPFAWLFEIYFPNHQKQFAAFCHIFYLLLKLSFVVLSASNKEKKSIK